MLELMQIQSHHVVPPGKGCYASAFLEMVVFVCSWPQGKFWADTEPPFFMLYTKRYHQAAQPLQHPTVVRVAPPPPYPTIAANGTTVPSDTPRHLSLLTMLSAGEALEAEAARLASLLTASLCLR